MKIRRLPYLVGLSTLGIASLGYSATSQFVHVVPKPGVQFQMPTQEGYHAGGVIWAAAEGQARVALTTEHVEVLKLGAFFEAIDTPEKATELCHLLHWGTLVESQDAFEKILALYRQQGFTLARGSGEVANLDEVRLNDAGMVFDALTQESPAGFDVAFTAFTLSRNLPNGMGAKASIARYQYTVTHDGQVVRKGVTSYVDGPYLNWQTGELSAEEAVEEQRAYQRRERLIEGIYKAHPHRRPCESTSAIGLSRPLITGLCVLPLHL